MSDTFTVYFAGSLFSHKDLVGNLMLAESIEKISQGKYKCFIPQDVELSISRSEDIRNNDLKGLIECDLGLYNFDGTDLDSGTVVEFVFAKFLDMPSVILRTDFRKAGDQDDGGDNWNLMCSGYPRTETVDLNGMQLYHEARAKSNANFGKLLELYTFEIARRVIDAFDKAVVQPSLFNGDRNKLNELYRWTMNVVGGNFPNLCGGMEFADLIAKRKAAKGLAD